MVGSRPVGFHGRCWFGRRVLLWGHPCGIVQRVVCIDSSRFSEDFRDEIDLGRLWRQRDRSLLEDLLKVSDLEGFPCTSGVRRQEDECQLETHSLDSIVDGKPRGGVTACGVCYG